MSETLCDKCGRQLGAGHERQDGDCVLDTEHVTAEFGLLCPRHYHRMTGVLREIVNLFALLPDRVVPGPSNEERRGSSVHSPAPGRLDVMALTEHRTNGVHYVDVDDAVPSIPDALASWVQLVLEERGIDQPTWSPALGKRDRAARARARRAGPACETCDHATCVYIRSGQGLVERLVAGEVCQGDYVYRRGRWVVRDDVASLVRILHRERRWVAAQLWVDDFTADLELLHRSVATAAGDSMWPRPIGKCPDCNRPLYPTVGIDVVRCHHCKHSWSGLALARLRLIFEQETG